MITSYKPQKGGIEMGKYYKQLCVTALLVFVIFAPNVDALSQDCSQQDCNQHPNPFFRR